jgi:hypothetical protein
MSSSEFFMFLLLVVTVFSSTHNLLKPPFVEENLKEKKQCPETPPSVGQGCTSAEPDEQI